MCHPPSISLFVGRLLSRSKLEPTHRRTLALDSSALPLTLTQTRSQKQEVPQNMPRFRCSTELQKQNEHVQMSHTGLVRPSKAQAAQVHVMHAKAGQVSMEMATQEGQKKKQLRSETGKMTILFERERFFFRPGSRFVYEYF